MNVDGIVEHTFSLIVEKEQLKESALALLNTVLFHRSTSNSLKPKDNNCVSIDFTYVSAVSSSKIDTAVGQLYSELSPPTPNATRQPSSSAGRNKGVIKLEFYRKQAGSLFSGPARRVWETWRFEFELRTSTFGEEHRISRANVSESLRKLVMEVTADILKKTTHLPGKASDTSAEVEIIDSNIKSLPYHFDISVEKPKSSGGSGFTELFKSVARSISTAT